MACSLLLPLHLLAPGSQRASKGPGRMAVTAGPSVLLSQDLRPGALNEPINGNQETNLVSIGNFPCDLGHILSLALTSLWVTCIVSQVLSSINMVC